jgi:DNA-binding beta-propeller fold protein YncE
MRSILTTTMPPPPLLLLSLGILLATNARPARAAEPASLRVTKTISLGDVAGRIDHMAIDPDAGLLFVAALGNNTVEAVDVNRGAVVARASGIREPQGVRVVPGGKVVVASGGDGMVRIYDQHLRELGHLANLDDADNVRLDAASGRVVVGYGGENSGGLAVIDPEKAAKRADIPLPGHPESFQLETGAGAGAGAGAGTRGRKRIFVNVPSVRVVAVVDRDKGQVIANWPLRAARGNFPMALDEARHALFVVCRRPARLVALDTATGKAAGDVETVGDADDLWIDEPAGKIYVTGGEGFIAVHRLPVPGAPPNLIEKIPTAAGARTSLFDPKSRRLYVAVPKGEGRAAEIRVFAAAPAAAARP